MKAALKKKWIAALRSGKYKQGDGYLRERQEDGTETFCCLGVLATVAGCKWRTPPAGGYAYRLGSSDDDQNFQFIPDRISVRLRVGPAGDEAGMEAPTTVQRRLGQRNDGDGVPRWSFKKIATWIEKNL